MRERYGARDERSHADALPHPDGGRLADRAAAANQRRADGDRGAGGGARRDAVAAHQLLDEALALPTEDAVRLALRTQQVIAHETGVDEHDRPARRLVLRRGADRPDRGARPTSYSGGSTSWAAWSRRSSRASRSARSPTPRTATSARSRRRRGSSSASTVRRTRARRGLRSSAHRPGRSSASRSSGCGDQGATRLGRRRAALGELAEAASVEERNLMP